MSVFEIILISIGLAMDAFGVSIGKGLSMPVGEMAERLHWHSYLGYSSFSCLLWAGLLVASLSMSYLNGIIGLSLDFSAI